MPNPRVYTAIDDLLLTIRLKTNQRIASELVLSLDAVKGHLRALFAKFGLEDQPQNRKRARLAECALELGLVRRGEL